MSDLGLAAEMMIEPEGNAGHGSAKARSQETTI
jgi:hypothetical protein